MRLLENAAVKSKWSYSARQEADILACLSIIILNCLRGLQPPQTILIANKLP